MAHCHAMLPWLAFEKGERFIISSKDGVVAATSFLGISSEVLLPEIWRVFALASMWGEPRAHSTEDRRIDGTSGHNHLSFGERGKVAKQVAPHAFNGSCHAFLIHFVDDAHNALRQTLAKHISVEFAGALGNESHTDAKLASFCQDLLKNPGRDGICACWGKVVGLFQQQENGIR